MKNKQVSVIIPVYNVNKYLERCIQSVLNQTYQDFEILLIDDGSTDGSSSICDYFCSRFPNIICIHQSNSGQAHARNVGLNICKGEYIYFLDSDDYIEPLMFEHLVGMIESYKCDIVCCRSRFFTESNNFRENAVVKEEITEIKPDNICYELFSQNKIRFELWDKIWKRDLIGQIRFVEGQLCEEVHFDIEAFIKNPSIVCTNLVFHNYMVSRPGNTREVFKLNKLSIFLEFDSYMNHYKLMNMYDQAYCVSAIASKYCIYFYCESIRKKQKKVIKKQIRREWKKYFNESFKSGLLPRHKMILFSVLPVVYYLFAERHKNANRR